MSEKGKRQQMNYDQKVLSEYEGKENGYTEEKFLNQENIKEEQHPMEKMISGADENGKSQKNAETKPEDTGYEQEKLENQDRKNEQIKEMGQVTLDRNPRKHHVELLTIIGEVEGSRLICLSDERHPRFEVIFGGKYEARPADVIVADEFIGEKSFKARGKRITTFEVNEIREIEPLLKEGEADEINTDIEFEVTNPEEIAGDEQMKLDFENTDNPDEI